MSLKSVLAIGAIVALSLPAAAVAQQTIGSNGAVLDGMGAGGNVQNHYVFDGPPNADVTSITTNRVNAKKLRVNRFECDIVGAVNCPAIDQREFRPQFLR